MKPGLPGKLKNTRKDCPGKKRNSQNTNLLQSAEAPKITGPLQQVQQLQSKLLLTEQIKAFVKQCKEQIKATLGHYTNLPGAPVNPMAAADEVLVGYNL